jgi:hypothetical protein
LLDKQHETCLGLAGFEVNLIELRTRNLIKPTPLEEITLRIILEKVLKCKNERKAGNKHPLSTPTAECK